jgi:hypothetical protein
MSSLGSHLTAAAKLLGDIVDNDDVNDLPSVDLR